MGRVLPYAQSRAGPESLEGCELIDSGKAFSGNT